MDGVLILTDSRLIFLLRQGIMKKSYLMAHYAPYKGISGISTGGVVRKHLAIQVKFKGKRKIDTLKYYLNPSELIPEYDQFIRKGVSEPKKNVVSSAGSLKCPKCNEKVLSKFKLCPYCGEVLK
jgi:hypothetical protein